MMKNLIQKIFGKKIKREEKEYLTVSDLDLKIPERFAKWISEIESGELPEKEIKGLNFGLFESTDSYMMYMMGAKRFDKENDNWACEVDYEPEYKYLDLNNSKLNSSNWEFILDYSISMIKGYLKENESFLNNVENITTGFDDGDLTQLK